MLKGRLNAPIFIRTRGRKNAWDWRFEKSERGQLGLPFAESNSRNQCEAKFQPFTLGPGRQVTASAAILRDSRDLYHSPSEENGLGGTLYPKAKVELSASGFA